MPSDLLLLLNLLKRLTPDYASQQQEQGDQKLQQPSTIDPAYCPHPNAFAEVSGRH
jgi:hypothetical protein